MMMNDRCVPHVRTEVVSESMERVVFTFLLGSRLVSEVKRRIPRPRPRVTWLSLFQAHCCALYEQAAPAFTP